jgi:hypothetical protein
MLRGKLMLTLIVGLVGFGAGLIAILGYFGINPPPPTPSVVIAHIEHPKGREIQNEYVQIKNEGQTEVNLLGWALSDYQDTHSFRLPSFLLKPGATVTIWTKSGTNTETDLYLGQKIPIWNDDKDTATLRDASGKKVCEVSYPP